MCFEIPSRTASLLTVMLKVGFVPQRKIHGTDACEWFFNCTWFVLFELDHLVPAMMAAAIHAKH